MPSCLACSLIRPRKAGRVTILDPSRICFEKACHVKLEAIKARLPCPIEIPFPLLDTYFLLRRTWHLISSLIPSNIRSACN